MLDLNSERLSWAEELWGFIPHGGQRTLFMDKAPLRIETLDRRWGKTSFIAIDIVTYALAFPHVVQGFCYPNFHLNKSMEEQIASLFQKAARNPAALDRFPFLRNLSNQQKVMMVNLVKTIVAVNTRQIGLNRVDRLFVDEGQNFDLTSFQSVSQCVKPDGQLTILCSKRQVVKETPTTDLAAHTHRVERHFVDKEVPSGMRSVSDWPMNWTEVIPASKKPSVVAWHDLEKDVEAQIAKEGNQGTPDKSPYLSHTRQVQG